VTKRPSRSGLGAAPDGMPDVRVTAVLVAVAVAVLIALAVAVSGQRYLVGEVAVLETANALPPAIGWPLRVVMVLGTLPAAVALTAAVARWARRAPLAGTWAVLVSAVIAFRADNVLKESIDRPRPPAVVADLDVRESIGGFGFPSGHSTMAFALAAALQPILPSRWRWLAWVLAALVGIARMYVGVHWPADVVGGAALGTAIGGATWLGVRWIVERRSPPSLADARLDE
jgi:membrane-associated phospholipid phosphatase